MPTTETTQAILIGRLPFQNTGLIISWIGDPAGRIKTIAKGALRPNSPIKTQLDLFYRAEIQYQPARRGDLHTLIELKLLDPFLGLRREYAVLEAAHYFIEIIQSLTEPNTPIPDYYSLLLKALTHLNTKPVEPRILRRFEQRCLELSGLNPEGDFRRTLATHGYPIPRLYSKLSGS